MGTPRHPTIPLAHLGTQDDQPAKFRLLQQVRHAVRTRGYSVRTEKTYVGWIRRFILFHSRRHPITMGDAEIREFITDLAVHRRVGPATQNQALAAILFLFKQVLRKPVGFVEGIVHSKSSRKLPVVLAPDEVRRILDKMTGRSRLCALLMYGSGLRVLETVSLRVKDVDFSRSEIIVRGGKGDKDRRVPLPQSVAGALRKQLQRVERQFALDLRAGLRGAALPGALSIKYPKAERELAWQYSFRLSESTVKRKRARVVGTTITNPPFSVQWRLRFRKPESPNARRATRSGTPSLRIYWRTERTSARSRSCSGTRTFARR